MKKIYILITASLFTLFCTGILLSSDAAESYTKSIKMEGNNNVEYNYTEHDKPDVREVKPDTDYNKYQGYLLEPDYGNNTYYGKYRPNYYPDYGYGTFYPIYGGQKVYTYTTTGIKYGPDGRVITPFGSSGMYRPYRPPMPQPPLRPFYPPNHYGPNHMHGFYPRR